MFVKNHLGLSFAFMQSKSSQWDQNGQKQPNCFLTKFVYADLKILNFGSRNIAAFYNPKFSFPFWREILVVIELGMTNAFCYCTC